MSLRKRGGHNKIEPELHKLRGTWRRDRHGQRLETTGEPTTAAALLRECGGDRRRVALRLSYISTPFLRQSGTLEELQALAAEFAPELAATGGGLLRERIEVLTHYDTETPLTGQAVGPTDSLELDTGAGGAAT